MQFLDEDDDNDEEEVEEEGEEAELNERVRIAKDWQ